VAVTLLATATVRADPPPPAQHRDDAPGVTVRADRVRAERERVEDTARFATSVDVRERGRVVESVADVLQEVPGLAPRRSGDGLAPTALTLRGAPAAHVTVALDGVVLNDASSDGVDVSLLPPAMLERADVYRGAAPVRLGLAGLGGAVELITRAPTAAPSAWLSAGYGMFGQRRGAVVLSASTRGVSTLLALGYRGTNGDFTFYSDRGTELFTGDDDPNARRVNNAADALDVLGRACVANGAARGCGLVLVGVRERGLPGPGAAQLTSPSLAQRRALGRLWYRAPIEAGTVELYGAIAARGDHFRDYQGEAMPGVPVDARGEDTGLEAGILGDLRAGSLRVEPVARARHESYSGSSYDGGPGLDASRMTGLLGADATLTLGALQLCPAFALEGVGDVARQDRAATPGPRVLLSPRVGVRWRVAPSVDLRANASHLERAPTLPELYGIGGALRGNPALVPETSDNADAGVVVHARARDVELRVEAAGYARSAHDLIVLLRSGVVSLKPFNLRGAEIYGAETSVRLAYRRAAALVLGYAYTSAITRSDAPEVDGRRVPAIPEHDLYARLEGALGPVRAWFDVSYTSGVYYDQANFSAAPPRALLGGAVVVALPFAPGLSVTALGTNLLDQRDATVTVYQGPPRDIRQPIADFAGYPLPGRSVFVSVAFTTERAP
jgi:iron complex outermembrane receptor protein